MTTGFGTTTIGGKQYEYEVLYNDLPKFQIRYNSVYYLLKRQFEKQHGVEFDNLNPEHVLHWPNQLWFWICWKCLVKKGWGPFRKPFRSMAKMAKKIRADEFQALVDLAGRDILKLRVSEEDREPGNPESRSQSQSTLSQ